MKTLGPRTLQLNILGLLIWLRIMCDIADWWLTYAFQIDFSFRIISFCFLVVQSPSILMTLVALMFIPLMQIYYVYTVLSPITKVIYRLHFELHVRHT